VKLYGKCEHCGCDPIDATLKDRYYDRAESISKEYSRLAADHAVQKALWRLQEIERIDDRKGLQRKVMEQRRTIKRLETKVQKLGAAPYAKDEEKP
jgi:hypothetical protein